MTAREYHLHDGKKGAALAVRVTPRARNNEIVEIQQNGTIRIRLTAPPVDNKANLALEKFLSDVLEVPKSHIEIIAGKKGRDKLVTVLDVDPERVQQRILSYIEFHQDN